MYSPVCVGPGPNPKTLVFSCEGSFFFPGTVAVSGDYENFAAVEAFQYGHIEDEEPYENPFTVP